MARTSYRAALKMGLAMAFSLATGAAQAADWSKTTLPWLPDGSGSTLGALPQTIAIPSQAYAYAVQSKRVDLFGRTEPAILRLTLRVRSGSLGVFLADADGSGMLSKEVVLTSTGADATVYFRVRPATPPAIVVLRNFNAPGQSGEVVLKAVQFVHEGDLTNPELAELVQQGLN